MLLPLHRLIIHCLNPVQSQMFRVLAGLVAGLGGVLTILYNTIRVKTSTWAHRVGDEAGAHCANGGTGT